MAWVYEMSFFWWGPRKQDMAKSVNDFGIWIQHGFVCFCICQMLLFKLRVHPMYAFDHYACTLGIKGTIFALLMLWCTNWATGVLEHTWPCGFLACTVNASGYLRCKRLKKKKKTCRCVVFHRAPHTVLKNNSYFGLLFCIHETWQLGNQTSPGDLQ